MVKLARCVSPLYVFQIVIAEKTDDDSMMFWRRRCFSPIKGCIRIYIGFIRQTAFFRYYALKVYVWKK
jgi:hypothetical protein